VRARAAVAALSDFSDDGEIVYGLANQSDADPSLEVQRACIVVVGNASACGFVDVEIMLRYERAVVEEWIERKYPLTVA
jgi:hypothetical protein